MKKYCLIFASVFLLLGAALSLPAAASPTPTLNIILRASPPGSGIVSGGGTYSSSVGHSQFHTITAEANTDYEFAGWYYGNTLISSNKTEILETKYESSRFIIDSSLERIYLDSTTITFEAHFEQINPPGIDTPSEPQNFTAEAGDRQVTLNWSTPLSDGGGRITSYQVSKDAGSTWETAQRSNTHTFTGLTNGVYYTFFVRAVNAAGEGDFAARAATPDTPPVLMVDTHTWNPLFSGNSISRAVTANIPWTADVSDNAASWLTVSPTSGSNNGSIIISVSTNTGTAARSGTVTVSGGEFKWEISVMQGGGLGEQQTADDNFDGITLRTIGMDSGYSYDLFFSGREGWDINVTDGALPPGLSLNRTDGRIEGTPTMQGTFYFTITASINPTIIEHFCIMVAARTPAPPPGSVTRVNIIPESASLTLNQTLNLTASITPSNAAKRTVHWYSMNPTVADINRTTGRVTALSPGTASVIVQTLDCGSWAESTITVTAPQAVQATTAPPVTAPPTTAPPATVRPTPPPTTAPPITAAPVTARPTTAPPPVTAAPATARPAATAPPTTADRPTAAPPTTAAAPAPITEQPTTTAPPVTTPPPTTTVSAQPNEREQGELPQTGVKNTTPIAALIGIASGFFIIIFKKNLVKKQKPAL